MKSIQWLLAVSTLLVSLAAQADYYKCSFTEPFIGLLLATDQKLVTITEMGSSAQTEKLLSVVHTLSGEVKIKTQSGRDIQIELKEAGNDGMSDYNYPYSVKLDGYYGGCEKSLVYQKVEFTLLKSMVWNEGLARADYWPGEYGYARGVKTLKELVIPKDIQRQKLDRNSSVQKACTLEANRIAGPLRARANEKFVYIEPSHRTRATRSDTLEGIQKGDPLKYIAYLSEGFCLYENLEGRIVNLGCEDIAPPSSKPPVSQHEVPLGHWMLLQCKAGHYSWIHLEALVTLPEVEEIMIGFEY